ncbi:hypothetical protein SLEP1_g3719 [Rubroshorea leprosula]|uniref:Uncharacterized protein n=1 Tax=Rubroshorea leprosula TaxID=152421 RepID=A0AAV5HTX3_9ROSI|nr:hypothetical protein SLEP1_g3719 [Rubroshorea leprosula]
MDDFKLKGLSHTINPARIGVVTWGGRREVQKIHGKLPKIGEPKGN